MLRHRASRHLTTERYRYEGSLTRTTAFATDAWRAFAKRSVNVAARGARGMGGTARAAIRFSMTGGWNL